MRRKALTILCHGVTAISLLAGGLILLPSRSPAQAGQVTQEEKTSKPRKAKKVPADVESTAPAAAPAAKSHKAPAPVKNASDAEIQSAKASGKVWVNTDSGVYHKGGKWYGATKQGKFMTEQDAAKAGYRAAKNEK
jgi:hypothetical protein